MAKNTETKAEKSKKIPKENKAEERALRREQVRIACCAQYIDTRWFGVVMGEKDGAGGGIVRGPIQFSISRSVNKVEAIDFPMTVCAVHSEKEAESQKVNRTFGRKTILRYALFATEISVNPYWSGKANMSQEDLSLFLSMLPRIFENDASAGRSMMAVRKIVVAKHRSPGGDCPPHVLRECVRVTQTSEGEPHAYADFSVTCAPSPTPDVEMFTFDAWPTCDIAKALGLPKPESKPLTKGGAPIDHRYTMWLIWDVTDGNPNGNPDANNHPRMDEGTEQSLVSDVCLKRKVRNLATMAGMDIFISEGAVLARKVAAMYTLQGFDPPKEDDGEEPGTSGDD